jgi:hypothetical protein
MPQRTFGKLLLGRIIQVADLPMSVAMIPVRSLKTQNRQWKRKRYVFTASRRIAGRPALNLPGDQCRGRVVRGIFVQLLILAVIVVAIAYFAPTTQGSEVIAMSHWR